MGTRQLPVPTGAGGTLKLPVAVHAQASTGLESAVEIWRCPAPLAWWRSVLVACERHIFAVKARCDRVSFAFSGFRKTQVTRPYSISLCIDLAVI